MTVLLPKEELIKEIYLCNYRICIPSFAGSVPNRNSINLLFHRSVLLMLIWLVIQTTMPGDMFFWIFLAVIQYESGPDFTGIRDFSENTESVSSNFIINFLFT